MFEVIDKDSEHSVSFNPKTKFHLYLNQMGGVGVDIMIFSEDNVAVTEDCTASVSLKSEWLELNDQYFSKNDNDIEIKPKAKAGDVFWVRETFCEAGNFASDEFANSEVFAYKTKEAFFYHNERKLDTEYWNWDNIKWKPSIFMPKDACRIFLKVKEVIVEPLNTITQEGAEAEGVLIDDEGLSCWDYNKKCFHDIVPEQSFQTLWESINGKGSWEENPFVWVYKFEVIEKPDSF